MKRFFFHLVKGRDVVVDDLGTRLADLDAVVAEAQRVAVKMIVSEGVSAKEWVHWKLDVKDEEGTRLFFFPFDEVSVHEIAAAKSSGTQDSTTAKSA